MSKSFSHAFGAIALTLPYNAGWNNGTGYFDHAVRGEHAPKLKIGQRAKCETPAPNSRRLILVGTRFGNVVLFERFSPTPEGVRSQVITCNIPDEVRTMQLVPHGALNEDTVDQLAGGDQSCYTNVGLLIEEIRNLFLKTAEQEVPA